MSQFQSCVCVTPGNFMQACVWADSSLQDFVRGASGMQVEVSWSSACPWSRGQNENLLQLSSVTFTAVCVQPLVTKEDYPLCWRGSVWTPSSTFLRGRTYFSHKDCILGGLWKRQWRIPWLNFDSHSSERKWWNSVSSVNSVYVVLASSLSRPPLCIKWHQREAVAQMDYMWEGVTKNILQLR